MKHGDSKFNKYITPRSNIRPQVTEVHSLGNIASQLYYRGQPVPSFTLQSVLEELLAYLKNCHKPCILVAHNCAFDAPRLVKAIRSKSLVDEFQKVIVGFVDTLPLFRKKFP